MADNVDLARRAFEAFNRRDAEGVLELCDPDVELHVVTGAIAGHEGPYRGHEGVRRYLEDAQSVWAELQMTPRELREAGDSVVVVGRVYARGSGRIVDSPTGWVWRFREGRIVSGRVYPNPDDALEEAGLLDRGDG